MSFLQIPTLTTNNIIYKWILPIYFVCVLLLHVAFFIHYFQLAPVDMYYVDYMNLFLEIFICVFLIIRFFPFRTHVFHKEDSQIIFACAFFLLFQIGLGKWMEWTLHRIQGIIQPSE